MNGPDAVVDLLEANGVLLQRVGQEEQALPEADGAGVGEITPYAENSMKEYQPAETMDTYRSSAVFMELRF